MSLSGRNILESSPSETVATNRREGIVGPELSLGCDSVLSSQREIGHDRINGPRNVGNQEIGLVDQSELVLAQDQSLPSRRHNTASCLVAVDLDRPADIERCEEDVENKEAIVEGLLIIELLCSVERYFGT